MKKIYSILALLLCFTFTINAQVLHTVNSGSYYYTPTNLTIDVGDTVTWINDGGLHNVNFVASTITGSNFNNPESFISTPTTGPVLYTHIFTIPGLYNYDCSVGAHAQNGMAGTVTVNLGGCTDPNAFNYDSLATYDDGSCLYPDCNGIAYGTSLLDSCGVCQQAYIYDVVLHTVVLLDDTFNLSLSPTEILVMPNDPMNPYWNSSCSGCTDPLAANYDSTATIDDGSCLYADCNGIVSGTSLIDSCGVCQQAYIYNFVTHVPTFVNDTSGIVLGPTEILVMPNDSTNPLWNSSCSGCTDPLATNYDSTATIEDGSCIYPNTVYDIVSNSVDHTTLKVAVDACSLDGTLSGSGPFTLFAPTDAAFNALPSGTIPALLNDIPQLTGILLHHVVGDSVMSTMLTNGQVVTTLLGTNITVTIDTTGVYIENALVTVADVIADNGVVHVIDAVLLPPLGCTDPTALNYDSTAAVDNGSCLYPDCNGIAYGTSLIDDCGVCQQGFIYDNLFASIVQYVTDTFNLTLSPTEVFLMPNSNLNPLWNSSCNGCTDPNASNYDSTAIFDDGSCIYAIAPLFFSEHADGDGFNRYFEIFNPTSDTVILDDYAWARVGGNPTTVGVYETWNDFTPGAVILPNDIYIVAHSNSDAFIINQADMTSQLLSNGDDGLALVHGDEPLTPTHPDSGLYTILDWIGDWNGDPGTGWDVAGITAGTANHTLVRKCEVMMGDTSWTNAAGTDPTNSQWVVFGNENWNYLGSHSNSTIYSSTFDTICGGLSITVNGNVYDSSGVYVDTLISQLGCDSVLTTNLFVLSNSATFLNLNPTICYGDTVYVGGNAYYQTGVYTNVLTNSVGCDSVISLDLRVVSPTNLVYDICPGDSIQVGSNIYYSAGLYVDSLVAANGCDSVINTQINTYSQYNSIYGGILDNTVGGGGYYTGDQHLILDCYVPTEIVSATVYSDGNTIYEFELRDNNGNTLADTIYALVDGANLVTLNFEMPAGTDFELGVSPASNFGGLYRNNAGVSFPYDFGNLASITQSSAQQFGDYYYFYYNIEMRASSAPSEYSICQGESISIGSNVYTTSGLYIDTMMSSTGCDSLVYTNLTVNPIVTYQNNQTICLGEVYTIGNNVYSTSGTYIDTFATSFSCDSLVYTNLSVTQVSGGSSINNTTICYGDYFMVGNNMYTNTGTYYDTLIGSNGCDSTVTTNLTVLSAAYPVIYGGIPDSASAPGGYFAFDRRLVFDCYVPSRIVSAMIYVEDPGTLTFELRDDNGTIIESSTQSVVAGPQRVTLNFNLPVGNEYELGLDNPSQLGVFRSNSGVNYPYNFGNLASITGSTANSPGYYYFYYDIEMAATLTPNVVSLCDGNSITVGSNTYSTTGIYYDTLDAANFCDSIVYTDLTVNQPFVPSIATDPFDGKICLGDAATITASTGYQSYSWDNGMSGQIISVSPTSDQLYTLTTVDINGCSAVATVMIYVDSCNTGISENFANLMIYPNPSNGIVNIEFNNSDNNFDFIKVLNVLGEEVFEINEISENKNITTLDFSNHTKGVYLLKIKTSKGIINRKLVIE